MKYICISAANVAPARATSASTRVCTILAELIQQQEVEVHVKAVSERAKVGLAAVAV